MRAQPASQAIRDQKLALERRLQTGAAIVLAFAVLIVIVLRAGAHDVFASGWWRH